jgi:nicotinate-nucleotide adenylyltransferase
MRIGLFGGTFDPPHNAHLTLAKWVLNELDLDYIYLIPASIHAFKYNSAITSASLRYEMVQAAVKNVAKIRVSDIELEREDISYTVDTLKDFKNYENLPQSKLYYIMGMDNLRDFNRWKNPDTILSLAQVAVIRRVGAHDLKLMEKYQQKVTFLESPIIALSSTELRQAIHSGEDVSASIPRAVLEIIEKHQLYKYDL